jgi:1-phosphofructokinase family hexose kinase
VILAAGLSPAWQQIVVIDALALGEVNRAREVHWCASGKVLNVGRALHCLAGRGVGAARQDCKLKIENCKSQNDQTIGARTLAMVGGLTGEAIRREFAEFDIAARWIETKSPTRVCTTLLVAETGATTELVENAQPVTASELALFQTTYHEEASTAEVVVLTGSLPAGTPAKLYRDLITATPGRVVLDVQGEPLLAALEARPFVVKPNRDELGNTLGRPLETDDELHAAMRELCQRGATWVVVSQGKERVWIASEREILSAKPPPVAVINPIGCGDCLAAGIAACLASGADVPDAVLTGMAAAADNAGQLLPARLDVQRVEAFRGRIILHTVSNGAFHTNPKRQRGSD